MLNDEIITKLAEETVQSLGDIDESFREELLGLAKETIKGECRKRILKDLNRVAISKLDDYLHENDADYCDTVAAFLNDGSVKIKNESVGEVYLSYSVFCREKGFQALSKIAFSKEVQKQAKVTSTITSIAGRSIRIFKAI